MMHQRCREPGQQLIVPLAVSYGGSPVDDDVTVTSVDRTTGKRQWLRFSKGRFLLGVLLTALLFVVRNVHLIVTARVDNGPLFDESWIVKRGSNKDIAIVTLADTGSKISRFKDASRRDKLVYAEMHNYTLIACDRSLDNSRHVEWSKLRLVYLALQMYPIVLWLDVDTLIWNKQTSIEDIVAKNTGKGLIAQLDLRKARATRYWNAGVFLMQNTTAMQSILRKAYQKWHIVLLRGITYFDSDQDAMNSITGAMSQEMFQENVHLYDYNEMWGLYRDAQLDGSRPWILHFPNCLADCPRTFLEYYTNLTSRENNGPAR